MTELERQLMQALKQWGEQYEQGQKQQAEQLEALAKQVNALGSQYMRDQKQQAELVASLAGQVEALAKRIGTLTQHYTTLGDLLRTR